MQDGAPPHIAIRVQLFFGGHLQTHCDQLMFRNCLASMIARFHELRFVIIGIFKRQRLPECLTKVTDLKISIRRHIPYIHVDSLSLVVESAIFRAESVVELDGHIEHVLKHFFLSSVNYNCVLVLTVLLLCKTTGSSVFRDLCFSSVHTLTRSAI